MKLLKPLENIVLYLNSETNCTKVDNTVRNTNGDITTPATRIYEFSWNNIMPISLNEYTALKVISIAHDTTTHNTDHGDNIVTFRLKDVIYNTDLYRSTDNSAYPILHSMPFDTENPYNSLSLGGLYLTPQTINRISIVVSDSMTNANNGISANMKFIIGLVFIPYDRVLSAVEN